MIVTCEEISRVDIIQLMIQIPETKLANLVPKHLLVDVATRFNVIFNYGVTFSSPWGIKLKREYAAAFYLVLSQEEERKKNGGTRSAGAPLFLATEC